MNDEKVMKSLDLDRFEELFRLSVKTIGGKGSVENGTPSKGGDGINPDSTDSSTKRMTKRSEKKRLMDANRHRWVNILLSKATISRIRVLPCVTL